MRFEYVFIGAGPASLVAANYLLEQGVTNILILEEGCEMEKRSCPTSHEHSCSSCSGDLCQLVQGEGGSSAFHGNKLCYFPASPRISNYFKKEALINAHVYLNNLLGSWFEASCSSYNNSFTAKKIYGSCIIKQSCFSQLISKLLCRPRAENLLQINTAVVDIQKVPYSGFRLVTARGDKIDTRQLIIGCGRSSHAFLRRVFPALGIRYCDNCQDIGIRLEAKPDAYTSIYYYQADPKYKFAHAQHGFSRTFCACNGGCIVPVKFGSAFYADGAFGNELTNLNNIAFMVRSREPIPTRDLEMWCAKVNARGGGGLFLGRVSLDTNDTQSLIHAIVSLIPEWPTESHRIMISEMLEFTLTGRYKLFNQCKESVAIYGPAIDLYWPKPSTT